MKQVNTFNKGGIADLDTSLIENNRFIFPTLNVRLTNYKGKGLVPTTIEGDEIAFDLGDLHFGDCKIYGAVEFGGILYMAIGGDDFSTIACYPSPKSIIYSETLGGYWVYQNTLTGFESKIAPLITIEYDVFGSPLYFQGEDDFLQFRKHIEMLARPSYDGSVDLYLCDYTNDNKVINTCFNQDGEVLSNRLILFDSAKILYNQILYAESVPIIELDGLVSGGGRTAPGMYFVYVRYVDENFNRTTFSAASKPIPVASDSQERDDNVNIGIQEMDWINNNNQFTNKSIEISISNIDTRMDSLEVAIVRMSSIEENAIPIPEVYLIDNYYEIVGSTKTIKISGLEKRRLLSIEEITHIENHFRISKAHRQINDRYIGVNWKSVKNQSIEDEVKAFAQNCQLHVELDLEDDVTFDDLNSEGGAHSDYQYSKVDNIHNKIGFFRDEVYPYSMYVQFKNGYKSNVYPLKGTDGNLKGLLWFDSSSLSDDAYMQYSGILKCVIDFPDKDDYFTNTENIDSINILRGERSNNLLYNGILHPVFNHTNLNGYDRYFKSPTDDENSSYYIPLSFNYVPPPVDPTEIIAYIIADDLTDLSNEIDLLTGMSDGDVIIYQYIEMSGGYEQIIYGKQEYDGASWGNVTLNEGDFFDQDGTIWLYENNFVGFRLYSLPMTYKIPCGSKTVGETYSYFSGNGLSSDSKRMALISPDFTIKKTIPTGQSIVKTYFKADQDIKNTFYDTSPVVYCSSRHQKDNVVTPIAKSLNATVYPVPRLTDKGEGRFTSMFRDGYLYDKNNGGAINFDGDEITYYNRSLYTIDYIGILLNEEYASVEDLYGAQASIFSVEPSDNYNTLLSSFSPENTEYKVIKTIKNEDVIESSIDVYGGDCFNQLTYLRLLRWFGADDNPDVSIMGSGKYYQHGLLVGFNSQNSINFQLRNDVKVSVSSGVVEYTYFPKIRRTEGVEGWVYFNQDDKYSFEALQVNLGYNETIPPIGILGYNSREKVITKFTNRVFASAKHVSSSYSDAYRNILVTDYRDYELGKGAIVALYDVLGRTLLIQTNQMAEVVIDERVMQGSNVNDLLAVKSGDVLSEKTRPVSDYGAHDTTHTIETDIGIFGIDVKKKILWMSKIERTDRGYSYLSAIDIGEQLGIKYEIEKLLSSSPKRTDITGIPFTEDENKLILGYDSKHGEIHITVKSLRDYEITDYDIIDHEDGYTRILAFNHGIVQTDYNGFVNDEPITVDVKNENEIVVTSIINGNEVIYITDAFIERTLVIHKSMTLYCDRSYIPMRYMAISNDFYTVYGSIVKKNNIGRQNTFNGVTHKTIISYPVSGVEGENSYMAYEKIFESSIVEMAGIIPNKATFKTDYQYSEYDFSETKFGLQSEYINQSWYFPIPPSIIKYSVDEKDYLKIDRNLQGRNLIVSLHFTPDQLTNKNIFVRSAITNFKPIGF
jgi:hypothetical protein